jgi:hypothetical protein
MKPADEMSALPPKADIDRACRDVRFVPKADILRCGKDPPYSIASSAATSRLCGTVTEHEQLAANRDTADL